MRLAYCIIACSLLFLFVLYVCYDQMAEHDRRAIKLTHLREQWKDTPEVAR